MKSLVSLIILFSPFCILYAVIKLICNKKLKFQVKSSEGKVTDVTSVSLLEVKVTLPTKMIFGDEVTARMYDPSELAKLPKVGLGEGTLGTLFKVVLDCGSIITIRKIREGFVEFDDLELWIKFFGGIKDSWLLPIEHSFWYGGEAFVLYKYLCLGSLEELLHGSEGIQFTPLSWEMRKHIALCAAMAVDSVHCRATQSGNTLVCGVIKASNILIRNDFSACLSGYEMPYLVNPAIIIRRNPGRIAPELKHSQNYPKRFTTKSDVYSYGILLLELVTAKKPTVTNLAEFLLKGQKRVEDVFDKKMGEVKDDMIEIIGIAQHCLARKSKDRPSMNRVVKMLRELQE